VTNNIRTPLSALRASLESLAVGFAAGDPRALLLRGATSELQRLGHNVQALLDWSLPPNIRPLACTLEEIAHAALDGLSADCKTCVLLAVENGDARLTVDGALLARCLSHLIELGLEDRAQTILLSAREEGSNITFAVVRPARALPANVAAAGTRETSLGLGLSLARRDIERMGANLTTRRTSSGRVVHKIEFDRNTKASQG
jgi:K+-sensing histidine kinase KdpD